MTPWMRKQFIDCEVLSSGSVPRKGLSREWASDKVWRKGVVSAPTKPPGLWLIGLSHYGNDRDVGDSPGSTSMHPSTVFQTPPLSHFIFTTTSWVGTPSERFTRAFLQGRYPTGGPLNCEHDLIQKCLSLSCIPLLLNMDGPRDGYTKWIQTKTNICYCIYAESKKKWYKCTYSQNRNRLTDLENTFLVTKGERGWGGIN